MSSKKRSFTDVPSLQEVKDFVKQHNGVVSRAALFKAFPLTTAAQKKAFRKLAQKLNISYTKKNQPSKRRPDNPVEGTLVGQVQKTPRGLRFIPADSRIREAFFIENLLSLPKEKIGSMFKAQLAAGATNKVKLLEPLGTVADISRVATALYDIPTEFPPEVLEEANNVSVPPLGKREDIRSLKLVTIEGQDSRDFDDAVWAEPDKDPHNVGGWHLIVAIADVAYYVRPNTPLDKEAVKRGTSVYFPDRVVPMLPETLSNGVCSLNPGVDRACVGVHLWIDHAGHKRRHQFFRGLMCSAARLTYEEVQRVKDTPHSDHPHKDLILNLFRAYGSLSKARAERGTLEIEGSEPYIIFDKKGHIQEITPRVRLESHQLIEEFMILANVAAAETLKKNHLPCLYRVHDTPDAEKVENLKFALRHLGLKVSGPLHTPHDFTHLLASVKGTLLSSVINDLVLRCQQQAVYTPINIGHFGLNLKEYCHFTSPIRRYPDILVHRGLLSSLKLEDGLPDNAASSFGEWGRECSSTERRAVSAEREAMDRYMTYFLAPRIGEFFPAYISGITKAGLFLTVKDVGASGFIPLKFLKDDYYIYRENPSRIEGRSRKKVYNFGDMIKAKLIEADLVRGRLLFSL